MGKKKGRSQSQPQAQAQAQTQSAAQAHIQSNTQSTSNTGANTDQYVRGKVLEYLVKKGYSRTEQTLRAESAHVDSDGRPIQPAPESHGYPKYSKAFTLIRDWAEGALEVYKVRFHPPPLEGYCL